MDKERRKLANELTGKERRYEKVCSARRVIDIGDGMDVEDSKL